MLIERERELSALGDALDGLQRGQGFVMTIDGAPGIGKTRVLDAAGELGADRGATVLRARGVEVERDVSFGIVRQLLERELLSAPDSVRTQWTGGAAGLSLSIFGEQWATDPHAANVEPTLGLLHGIYWLTANISTTEPLVLLVDDAQWADAPSMRALAYLGRRLAELPVALIVSARELALDELLSDPAVTRVTLGPLTAAGSAQLVAAIGPAGIDRAALDACHASTGGNPFLLRELVFALEQAGRGITAATVVELSESAADTISHAVMLRLGALGADALSVAAAVAVLDIDSQLGLVAALAELDVQTTAEQADRLSAAHILADATPLRFAHPLLRAAVYHDLTAVRRAVLHKRAAQLIGDVERVATHLLHTEPVGDEHTVDVLLEAAANATAKAAPASAAHYLSRALEEPPPDRRRGEVLVRLGVAALRSGEAARAEPRLREALVLLTEPEQRAEAGLALAEALANAAGPDAAVQVLNEVAAELGGEAYLRVDIERTGMSVFVPELAAAAAERMKEFAKFNGDTPMERLALASAALAYTFDPTMSAARVLALARRALADGALLAEHTADAAPYASCMGVTISCEDPETADREAELAVADARRRGSVLGFATSTMYNSMTALLRGEITDAITHGEAAVTAARDLGRTPMTTRFFDAATSVLLAEALVARGELARARAIVSETSAIGDLHTPELCPALYARGVVAFADGDASAALADFLGYGAVATQVGYEERIIDWRARAALAAHALGDAEAAIGYADDGVAITRTWGAPRGLGVALRARALVGRPNERCERLAEAVGVLGTSVGRLDLATAVVDLGVALARDGKRRDAREALERGMDLAAGCEARALAERAAQELRILGARPRRLRISGLDALTGSERRVAVMAADGATNREIAQALFVTQKTVENHLASVYRKLDLSSRRDLPATLAQSPD